MSDYIDISNDTLADSEKEVVKEEIKEVIKEVVKELKPKEKKCAVVLTTKEFAIIDFDGYGITIAPTDKKEITVKYFGTFGKSDFKLI